MTVKELYDACAEMIAKGDGEKEVVLCVSETEFQDIVDGFSLPENNNREVYPYCMDWGYESKEEIDKNVCVLS